MKNIDYQYFLHKFMLLKRTSLMIANQHEQKLVRYNIGVDNKSNKFNHFETVVKCCCAGCSVKGHLIFHGDSQSRVDIRMLRCVFYLSDVDNRPQPHSATTAAGQKPVMAANQNACKATHESGIIGGPPKGSSIRDPSVAVFVNCPMID